MKRRGVAREHFFLSCCLALLQLVYAMKSAEKSSSFGHPPTPVKFFFHHGGWLLSYGIILLSFLVEGRVACGVMREVDGRGF